MIGPNGAGKTTLLKLLTGELAPDSGSVRLGTNLEIARFDQHRDQLDPECTPWETLCPAGGDRVQVMGQSRHVVGYLRDFLFRDEQARQPIRALSGGERNRLLLAKILAQPSNLLMLDEPTNDLDIDTLDLLEETLADYAGTLLLVSHDRDFLDRLVTSTIVFEGGGRVSEYAGGYSDWLTQRQAGPPGAPKAPAAPSRRGRRSGGPGLSMPNCSASSIACRTAWPRSRGRSRRPSSAWAMRRSMRVIRRASGVSPSSWTSAARARGDGGALAGVGSAKGNSGDGYRLKPDRPRMLGHTARSNATIVRLSMAPPYPL